MDPPIVIQHAPDAGPWLATSVHAGHGVRSSLAPVLQLTDAERLREEDPYTDVLASFCPTRVITRQSRFEVDFNRAPPQALYLRPEDAWGLHVWKEPLGDSSIAKTMHEYRVFYATLRSLLEGLESRFGRFVVFDMHTYNHRRAGPRAAPADPDLNPEVNVGTGSMDRGRFGHVVERFMTDLQAYDFRGRQLDVRENVRFRGGYLCRWVHEHFPITGCAMAIEVKKFFMDEWTGQVDEPQLKELSAAFASTLAGVRDALLSARPLQPEAAQWTK